jgi:outer membrane protein assembly factor BamB
MLFVGAFNGKLLAIDATSGKISWEFRTDGAKRDPLKVLASDGSIDQRAYGAVFHNFLDMTVHLYRMFSVGAILSSPVVDRGTIYFGSADGSVYAIY